MTEISIKTSHLTKRFQGKPALVDVSLEIKRGERIALIGNNGSGKTTLLSLLNTLLRPSEGQAWVHGHDVVKNPNELRGLIGVMQHQPMLHTNFSPIEELNLFAKLYKVGDADLRIREVLKQVGLSKKVSARIGEFSRGQKQRLMIAKCLLNKPLVLLLDEPEIGLDANGLDLLDQLILKPDSQKQITVLSATHRTERINDWATGMIRVDDGKLVESVTY